jgi:hypothetical protein
LNVRKLNLSRLAVVAAALTLCASATADDAARSATNESENTAQTSTLSAREARRAERRAESEARRAAKNADAAGLEETAETAEAADEPELICRREAEVGSHFRARRCYTPEQIEEAREQSQELMRDNLRARRQVSEPQG